MHINPTALDTIERYDTLNLAKLGGITVPVIVPSLADMYLRQIRDELLAAAKDYEDEYATPDTGTLTDRACDSTVYAASDDDAWQTVFELRLWAHESGDDTIRMYTGEYMSNVAESVLETFARHLSFKLAEELLAK
jgi:hypothetical protein